MNVIGASLDTIRPETGLMLSCARAHIDAVAADRIHQLLDAGLQWTVVYQKAIFHGTLPLLVHHLKTVCPDRVPSAVMRQLETAFHRSTQNNLLLTNELLKLLHLFETHGIAALPFKGPTLSAAIYGNVILRQFSDLDILVLPQDRLWARELLMAQGYTWFKAMSETQQEAHEQSGHAYTLVHRDSRITVDLHWALAQYHYAIHLDPEPYWQRVETVSICGKTVHSMPRDELLVYLCLHGAKHYWERLGWICDIAELIDHSANLHWSRLLSRARRDHIQRLLFLGLLLAHDLLGATLPGDVLHTIQGDVRARSLTRRVSQHVLSRPERSLGVLKYRLLYPKMRERLQDKMPYMLHHLRRALTPNARDQMLLPLPPGLTFLHYLIRPLRLFGEYGPLPLKRLWKRCV